MTGESFRRSASWFSLANKIIIISACILEIFVQVVYDIKRTHEEFRSRGLYPVDYAFEARMMAGSDMVMSAQYGKSMSISMLLRESEDLNTNIVVCRQHSLSLY